MIPSQVRPVLVLPILIKVERSIDSSKYMESKDGNDGDDVLEYRNSRSPNPTRTATSIFHLAFVHELRRKN